MRPKEYDFDFADESLTGFASNVTAGTWALTATVASDGYAHQVSIRNDSVTNHSAKTITLTGTDADGRAQTETLAAPNTSATVESTKYFKTLTAATVSATIGADTFDIGWVDEIASQTIPLNWRSVAGAVVNVDVTGTLNFTVQQTFDKVQDPTVKPQQDCQWVDVTALASKTADTMSALSPGATAMRIITSSYSSGAEFQANVVQTDY